MISESNAQEQKIEVICVPWSNNSTESDIFKSRTKWQHFVHFQIIYDYSYYMYSISFIHSFLYCQQMSKSICCYIWL